MFKRHLGCGIVFLLQTLGIILGLHFSSETVSAQESTETFTLAHGINHALSNSREFQVAQKDVELAAEKVKEARAALLPQLTLDASYTFNGDLSTIVLDSDFLQFLENPMPQDSSAGEVTDQIGTEPIEIELGAAHNFQ